MAKLMRVSKKTAIQIMEENLKVLKQSSDSDTFLLISYDLENESFLGRRRMDYTGGMNLVDRTKTFVLNKDIDEDPISTLSMYTHTQKDIFNIIKKGEKHDMIIVPQLE